MLILTRKPGESVMIEESVRITVLEVRGSQVKLGIQAPLDVRVNREEVLERQRAEAGLPPITDMPLPPAPSRVAAAEPRRRAPHERMPPDVRTGNGRGDSGRPGMRAGREGPARPAEPRPPAGRAGRPEHSPRDHRDEPGEGRVQGPAPRDRGAGPREREAARPGRDERFGLRGSRPRHREGPPHAEDEALGEPVVRRYRAPEGPRAHRAGRLGERRPDPTPHQEPASGPEPGPREPGGPPLEDTAPGQASRRPRRAGDSEAA